MVLDDRFHSEPPVSAEDLQCRPPVAAQRSSSTDSRIHTDAACTICLHTIHCSAFSDRH